LGLTGLGIEGGIASVSRTVGRALNDAIEVGRVSQTDQIVLLPDTLQPQPLPRSGERRYSGGSQLRFSWQLWRSFRAQHQEIVFFDQLGLARAAQLPLPGFPPPRYAIFVHGIELTRAERGRRRAVLTGAWRLIANSAFTAERVRRDFPECADRVRLATLCIDQEKIEAWQAMDLPAPQTVRARAVMIVGRMWAEEPGKGHDALIDCWPAVQAQVPDAELWIVGEGDDRQRLEARARKLGSAVRFLGRISDTELSRRFRQAALFAMPSRQEGFGLVYAEAMWHGLPCVGSTADAAKDVIAEGKTGALVPYGAPEELGRTLTALLLDPARRQRLSEDAWRHARDRFSYPRFRREFLAALDLES